MGIVAGRAGLLGRLSKLPVPITAGPSVNARLPIAIGRAMATAAKLRAFRQFQSVTVPRHQLIEVRRVVAIVTMIVAFVSSMLESKILVFVRQDHIVVLIQFDLRRFGSVVTRIAILAGRIASGPNEFSRRNTHGRRVRELRIHRSHGHDRFGAAP